MLEHHLSNIEKVLSHKQNLDRRQFLRASTITTTLLLTGCAAKGSRANFIYSLISAEPAIPDAPEEAVEESAETEDLEENPEDQNAEAEDLPFEGPRTVENMPESVRVKYSGKTVKQTDYPTYDSLGGISNCGPTALANALNYTGTVNTTTKEIVHLVSGPAWNKETGYDAPLLPGVVNSAYSEVLKATPTTFSNSDQIKLAIWKTQNPVWLSVFYGSNTGVGLSNNGLGHAITVIGVDKNVVTYIDSYDGQVKTMAKTSFDIAVPLNRGQAITFTTL